MEALRALPEDRRADFLGRLDPGAAEALRWSWEAWARPSQLPPPGDWRVWLILAGRGWGKTRTGAEWVRAQVKAGVKRIALISETAQDARDVMIEGPSGIMAVHPPDERPRYIPSQRRLTWPNGAVATVYYAVKPDQLRGPQFDAAWLDEFAKWRYAQAAWDQLQFGLRLGSRPRVLVTTTPRPIAALTDLVARPDTVVTRGATDDNAANLAPGFVAYIRDRYGGTRLGRQEIMGEILGDLPGALWSHGVIDSYRRSAPPDDLRRVVVAVDPAVSSGDGADEHGIIVAGITEAGEGVVLDDVSLRGSPLDWARAAVGAAKRHDADAIVAEVNQGGDMVEQTIRGVDAMLRVIKVRATRGKHVRAEPVAALYEQGKVAHVGYFDDLEQQMLQMTSGGYLGKGSPDRLDALVWALTELFRRPVARKVDASIYDAPPAAPGHWMAV